MGGCDLSLAGCDHFFDWVWGLVIFFWLGVDGCGWVWPFYDWVWVVGPFFSWAWVSVGECDLFLAGCEWMWVSVTFFWLGEGGCGWVWPFFGWVWVDVSVTFFDSVWVGVGDCTVYNYPIIINKPTGSYYIL